MLSVWSLAGSTVLGSSGNSRMWGLEEEAPWRRTWEVMLHPWVHPFAWLLAHCEVQNLLRHILLSCHHDILPKQLCTEPSDWEVKQPD